MRHAIVTSLVLTLAMSATAFAQPQGLEGTWHLDVARSQLNWQPATSRSTLKFTIQVVIEGDHITVTEALESPLVTGSALRWEMYELDGKPRPMPTDLIPSPPRTRTAVWREDTRGFDVEEFDSGTGRRMRGTWRLSENGRILTIDEMWSEPFPWQQMRIFVRDSDLASLSPPFDFAVTPIFVDGGPVFVFVCPNLIGTSMTVAELFAGFAVQLDGVVYPYVGPMPQSMPTASDLSRLSVMADLRQDRTGPPPRYPGAGRLAWSIPITNRPHTIAFRCAGEWSDLMNFYDAR